MEYKFIQPSDCITFEAEDENIAKAACIYVGNGHCFLEDKEGNPISGTAHLFEEFPKEEIKVLEDVIENKDKRFIEALRSFACCDFSDRESYKDITKNYTNRERMNVWHDKHRTSLTDWCAYAWSEAELISSIWDK